MDTKLQEYAKLLIEVGLNVQKGQTLIISSPVECASFARLCLALGAHTAGVRRDPARPADGIQRMYGFSELDELLPRADVVALTLPQSPETAGLFGRERLLRQEIPFGVHDYPIPWVLTEAGLFEDGTPSRLE